MAVQFSNNAATNLSAAISASATSITVADASEFPTLSGSDYTYVTLSNLLETTVEVVKVTAISGNTLTVVRGQDNTTASVFASGDKCELRVTAALLNDVAEQADTNTEYTAGSGITLTGTTFSNSAPDQTVALTGAGATTISGTYPNFTISSTDTNTDTNTEYTAGSGITLTGTTFSNSAPDQTVSLTGAGATTISGTYPNFTITSTDTNTDTNTEYTAGSGITLTGTVFSNSAPDQTVALTGSGGTTVSGTYPNFTISSAASIDGTTINPASVQIGGTTVIDSSRNVILGDAVLSHSTDSPWRGLTIQNNGDGNEATVDGKSSDGTQQFVVYGGSQAQGFLHPTSYAWRFKIPLTGSFTRDNTHTVWDSGNDGSGSGLDADLLDGQQPSALSVNYANTAGSANSIDGWGFVNTGSNASTNADTIDSNGISYYTAGVTNFSGNATDGALYSQRYSSSWQHQIAGDFRSGQIAIRGRNSGNWQPWYKVWSENNDGSGSGLDADTVDGVQAASLVGTHGGHNRSVEAEVGALHFYADGGNSGQANHSYALFQEAGAWSHPYPYLRIAFHTGIKIGGYFGYGGNRFYNNNDMVTETFSVNNGDDNTRVLYNLKVSSQTDSYSYIGNANVAGTGNASYHPSGIYSTGTNWLYGDRHYNGTSSYYTGGSIESCRDVVCNAAFGRGVVGLYSPSVYQHVWSMGTAYQLAANGASSGTGGNLYGLAWSYNPNYGYSGSNAQSKSGLNHQLLLMQNGNTTFAAGSGVWTNGNVTAYSDRRVKTNIEVIPDAVSKVKQLSGYVFDRTDVEEDSSTGETNPVRQTGVIAQEVLAVLPEAVMGTDEEGYSVAYGNMVGLLIEAIKEQQGQIEDLKQEIQTLKVAS